MQRSGINNDTTVILYGDNNNWFAAWALWQMKIYGHKDVRLMNGGRKKWIAEGRELNLAMLSRFAVYVERSRGESSSIFSAWHRLDEVVAAATKPIDEIA